MSTTTRPESRWSWRPRGPGRPASTTAVRGSERWLLFFERFGLVLLVLAAAVFFSIVEPDTFATVRNWQLIAGSIAVPAIAALALLVPLVARRFDLTVGITVTLSAVVLVGGMSRGGLALGVAFAIAVLVGLAVGAVNATLVAGFRVDSLIATLGVTTLVSGLIIWYTGGNTITSGISPALLSLGADRALGIPSVFIVMLVVAAFVWYLLEYTPFGRRLVSIGSNEQAARLVGISIARGVVASYLIAAVLAVLAGTLAVARSGAANPEAGGIGLVLPAFTAVFLGATTIHPGRFNVPGTLLGALFVAVFVSGLTLLGVAPWVEQVFNGAALLVAVSVSRVIRRRRTGE